MSNSNEAGHRSFTVVSVDWDYRECTIINILAEDIATGVRELEFKYLKPKGLVTVACFEGDQKDITTDWNEESQRQEKIQ
jgi:hypothetical protein